MPSPGSWGTDVSITLLGTGSPVPDPRRAGPSSLVTADGLSVLVDCGRGVLMRLAAGALPPFLDALLISRRRRLLRRLASGRS